MRLNVRVPKVDPHTYELPETYPCGNGGQAYCCHGTGDLELTVMTEDNLERIKSLLVRSYESN